MTYRRKHIKYTKNEVDTIRKHIMETPKRSRIVKYGNGMAPIVARHGKRSVEQKMAAMRDGLKAGAALRELVRNMQGFRDKPRGKSVFEHRGVWFLLGMIFAFSVALLI